MPITVKGKIIKAMKELGESPGEIHDTLVKGGFSGTPSHGRTCPVARYLNAKVSESVSVSGSTVYWDGKSVPTTAPVREFVGHFDMGKYPELVW